MSPLEIISIVPKKFEKALEAQDVFLFPSTITKHTDSDVEVLFEIRLCPALSNKPQRLNNLLPIAGANSDETNRETAATSDPFAPPYNSNLHIGDLEDDGGERYAALLNKYALIPQHFLLVTSEFRSQSSPLTPSDLVQTYLLLTASRKSGRSTFAFYNCGDHSGASQSHKHIQFIPTEDEGPPIERLAGSVNLETPDKPYSLSKLPYANHVIRFPPHLSSSAPNKLETILSAAFMNLLDLCISTIRHNPDYPPGKPSYNVIITSEHMHVIPRRKATHVLLQTGEQLGVNALGFAGMLLVKSERELEAVKAEGIGRILRSVGLESVHDLQVAGTSAEPEGE